VLATAPLALADDHLLVSGFDSDSVTRYAATTGAPLGALAAAGQDGVLGLAVGLDGQLYVCSEATDEVLRFDAASGAFLGKFIWDDPATVPDDTGGLDGPSGIVFGPDEHAYVCSFANDSVIEYDGRSGAFVRVLVASGTGGLNGPDAGLAFGPDGNLYVPSFFNDRVKRFAISNGAFLNNFIGPPAGLSRPRTVVFPGDGFVYVTSEGNDRVIQCDAITGAFVRNLVSDDPLTPADETGGLDGPTGLAFGFDGRVLVASLLTDAVLRYDAASGAFLDVLVPAGSGADAPTFLLLRPDARNYGPLTSNSFGPGATLVAEGSSSVAAQRLELALHGAPPNRSAIFFYGSASAQLPFGDGNLLVERATVRRLQTVLVDSLGRARHVFDFAAAASSPLPITAGSTFYFQAFLRDSIGAHANFSDAVAFTACP
jgi:hypothetical protein